MIIAGPTGYTPLLTAISYKSLKCAQYIISLIVSHPIHISWNRIASFKVEGAKVSVVLVI